MSTLRRLLEELDRHYPDETPRNVQLVGDFAEACRRELPALLDALDDARAQAAAEAARAERLAAALREATDALDSVLCEEFGCRARAERAMKTVKAVLALPATDALAEHDAALARKLARKIVGAARAQICVGEVERAADEFVPGWREKEPTP